MCIRPTSTPILQDDGDVPITTVRGTLRNLTKTVVRGKPTLIGFLESESSGLLKRTLFSLDGEILRFVEEHAPRWMTEGETVGFYGRRDGRSFAIIGISPDEVHQPISATRTWIGRAFQALAEIPQLSRFRRP